MLARGIYWKLPLYRVGLQHLTFSESLMGSSVSSVHRHCKQTSHGWALLMVDKLGRSDGSVIPLGSVLFFLGFFEFAKQKT